MGTINTNQSELSENKVVSTDDKTRIKARGLNYPLRFRIQVRSFHPSAYFGSPVKPDIYGFHGDNRGFSLEERPSSRVHHNIALTFLQDGKAKASAQTDSDSSEFAPYSNAMNALGKTDTGVIGNPQGTVPSISIEGGEYRVASSYAGSNAMIQFIPPLNLAGNKLSPDIDIHCDFRIRIDKRKKKFDLSTSILGDLFPCMECLIRDSKGNPVFIGVFQLNAESNVTQIVGDRGKVMIQQSLSLSLDWDGNFDGKVITELGEQLIVERNKGFLMLSPKGGHPIQQELDKSNQKRIEKKFEEGRRSGGIM